LYETEKGGTGPRSAEETHSWQPTGFGGAVFNSDGWGISRSQIHPSPMLSHISSPRSCTFVNSGFPGANGTIGLRSDQADMEKAAEKQHR
jgi:hypothetical protein